MMKKCSVLMLAVLAVLPAFTQTKSNHDFKSSVNTVTNGMFKEDVDKVLDVTGFNAIEGNIIGAQITNKTAANANATNLDFVWGKKFDWFYLGAGYNGSVIAQIGTNNTVIDQNNNYAGAGSEWTGSSTVTSIEKGVNSPGFSNNAQVLFGFKNMGFKLSFDSSVPNGIKRGTLDGNFDLKPNTTTVREGDELTGTYADTVYDAKGFTNGTGLVFKPHLDFGINLGLGMDLWVTAHAGLNFTNKDKFNGNTVTNYATAVAAPDFVSRTATKTYAHDTALDIIVGAEAGATFGIVEPSFAYDFGVRLNTAKTFADDKKTAFTGYKSTETITNSTGVQSLTSEYTGAAAARAQIWHNQIAPAVKISPDFGDKVKFALKVSLPVTFTSDDKIDINSGKAGLNSLTVTTYKYNHAPNPNDILKETVATYQNGSYNTFKTEIAPLVEMGIRLYTPSEKMSFNFGLGVVPFKYTHKTETTRVADNANVTTTEYANGETTVVYTPSQTTKKESKNSTDTWNAAGIDTLANIKVGFTWYVNTKLTFDFDFSVLGAAKSLLDNPFNNEAGTPFQGKVGLTAVYKY